jgi:exo-beta-1,3-glucanase (GH17 family)
MRSDSPTRVPLTAGAGAAAGYEMSERKPGDFDKVPTAAWLKEEQRSRAKRKWIIIGVILFLLAAAAAGVTVYLVKFRNSGSSSNTGSSSGRNGAGATAKDLKIDSKLKKIFTGMDYTPLDAQYPGCGCTQANITADVAILSQLTSKIRLYGTDCSQATMVLDAIQSLKVDLTVFLGVWVDNNSTTLERQLNDMYDILNKYPVDLIDGIAVGNEVLFRQDLTETQLIALIQQVKTNVTALNLSKSLPICTRYCPYLRN